MGREVALRHIGAPNSDFQQPSTAHQQPVSFATFRTPDAHNIRLYRLYIRRRFDLCRDIVQKILNNYPEALCESQLCLMGKISQETGNLRESLNWLERARANNPNSAKLLHEVGKAHYLLAEHDRAIEMFEQAIKQNPDDWKNYYWQSLAYYNAYPHPLCHEKAQEALVACLKLKKSVDMLVFLGRLFLEQKKFKSAIEIYKTSIQLEPENIEIMHKLGMLYLRMQEEENAFAVLGEALTHDSTYVPNVLAIAHVLQSRGDYDVALSKYKIIAVDFDHSAVLWNNIGMCYFGRGKLISAISCLNKANYLCPLEWNVLYNLAMCYYSMRQYASAYHFISTAFAICPTNPLILMMLGMTLTELGDLRNARSAYKRALKLDPSIPIVRLNIALFEFRHGNTITAVRRVGAALREFTAEYALKSVVATLFECFQRLAYEDSEIEALLKRIITERVSVQQLDAESDAIEEQAARTAAA